MAISNIDEVRRKTSLKIVTGGSIDAIAGYCGRADWIVSTTFLESKPPGEIFFACWGFPGVQAKKKALVRAFEGNCEDGVSI